MTAPFADLIPLVKSDKCDLRGLQPRLILSYIRSIAKQSQLDLMLKRYELLNEVESKGVRLTAQRRALIETIQEATSHLDAASLLEMARRRDSRIDRATVYRTIELLRGWD